MSTAKPETVSLADGAGATARPTPSRAGTIFRLRPQTKNIRLASRPRRMMVAMATSSKRAAASAKKPSSGLQPEPGGQTSKPFLRFYHSAALRKKTLSLLDVIEQAADATAHRDELSNLVVELSSAGMDYFFIKQLKLVKPGFIVEQSANLGMAGVQQVMGSVIRKIIARMDSVQLLSVCGSIRRLML